jgi:hypothetical protein
MENPVPKRLAPWLETFIFLSGLIWISAIAWDRVSHDLQRDFDVFYCAGLSVQEGLSPYDNNMDKDPRSWDGNPYSNSGFLFPPLTARLFVPLSYFSYPVAKALWTALTLACLASALIMLTLLLWPKAGLSGQLFVLGVAFWYFPTLYQVQNENIDSQVFFVVSAGFALAYHYRRAWAQAALGACLAFAVLLKLDTLLFMPGVFMLRWRPVLAGFLAGASLLMAGSLALDGAAANQDYLFHRLGRIFRTENLGSPEQKIDAEKIAKISPGYPGVYLKDGNSYSIGLSRFLGSASGTGVLASHSPGHRLLVMLLTPLLLWALAYGFSRGLGSQDRTLAFFFFGLLITLFCAPFTWVQRMFWVLPILPWLLKNLREGQANGMRWPYLFCALCIGMIGLPIPAAKGMGFYYCLPTLLLILSLLAVFRARETASPAFQTAP